MPLSVVSCRALERCCLASLRISRAHDRGRPASKLNSMPMLVRVGFARRILWPMGMLMMLIMRVSMRMSYRFMVVDMLMAFRNVKPHPESHQCTSNNQWEGRWLAECKDGCRRAKKGGG